MAELLSLKEYLKLSSLNTVMLVLWVCICRSSNFIVMWYISYFIQSHIQHLGYSNFASHLFSMVVVMCFFVLSACRLLFILFKLLTKNIQRYSTVLKLRGMFWQNKKYLIPWIIDYHKYTFIDISLQLVPMSMGVYGIIYFCCTDQFQWQNLISCLFKMCMYFQYLSFTADESDRINFNRIYWSYHLKQGSPLSMRY